MMLAVATLAAYLQTCAASVAPDTMRAIVSVESRGYIYAINDNTARAAYCVPGGAAYPCSRSEAAAIASRAIALRHSVDVGIAQVNSSNFGPYHVSVANMLEPCENLETGSAILAAAYRTARTRFPDQREALWHAIMAYNTGNLYAGESYVRSVVEAALPMDSIPTVPSVTILTLAGSPSSTFQSNDGKPPKRPTRARRASIKPNAAPLLAPLSATPQRGDSADTLAPALPNW
jgi:type IV secretion system protein VirB1